MPSHARLGSAQTNPLHSLPLSAIRYIHCRYQAPPSSEGLSGGHFGSLLPDRGGPSASEETSNWSVYDDFTSCHKARQLAQHAIHGTLSHAPASALHPGTQPVSKPLLPCRASLSPGVEASPGGHRPVTVFLAVLDRLAGVPFSAGAGVLTAAGDEPADGGDDN